MRRRLLRLSVAVSCRAREAGERVRECFASDRAEGYIDSVIKMAIAVVIGGFILLALVNIIGEDESKGLLGTIKTNLENMFNKSQTGP